MLSSILLWGLSLTVLSWLVNATYHAYSTPLRSIPGPWHAKFTNVVLKFNILTGKRVHYIHALHARYGPFVRIAPTEVAVNDLAAYKQIHRIGGGFLKDPWYQQLNKSPTPGIFSLIDAKDHAERRKLLSQGFSKSFLRQHWEDEIHAKATKAVAKIKRDMLDGGAADIFKWWTFYATDVIGHIAFGESFNMLDVEQVTPYILTLQTVLFEGGLRAELPLVHALGSHLPVPAVREFFSADAKLAVHGAAAIANSRAADSPRSIFAKMLAEVQRGRLREAEVSAEASNLIVAGSDTTAITLTYLCWAVLRQPHLQARLEAEVAALRPGFCDADVEALPLLGAVIEETLRLYGAAPGSLPRSVPAGGRELGGYFVPAGTTVSTQAFSMHRDAAFYEDPERFDPERFLAGAADEAAFYPWGGGSRVCIGLHLAKMELRVATALFFRECAGVRLQSVVEAEKDMQIENFFLIAPKGHRCLVTLKA